MKASKKTNQNIIDLMHRQIGNEFGLMVQYYTIASRFDKDLLPELNIHFSKLAERKKENALRFMDYVTGHGRSLTIPTIPTPQTQFSSTEEVVKFSLKKETEATDQFKMIEKVAKAETDHVTDDFMQELIDEQREEVSLMKELLGAVQKAGEGNLLVVEDFLIKKTSVAVEL